MHLRKWNWNVTSTRLKKMKTTTIFSVLRVIINTKDGTIDVEITGKFLIKSMDGKVAIFIVYDWTKNAILTTPIKNVSEEL